MKKIAGLTLLLALSASSVFAQLDYEIRNTMDLVRTNKLITGNFSNSLSEEQIKGSPYLNKEFISGNVFTKNKEKYADVPLRFNIYNDDIEFKTPDNQILALSQPETIEKVVFGKYEMEYVPFELGKKVKHGFLRVLEKGKANLYARSLVIFQKAKEAAAYKDPEPPKFIPRADVYYISIDNKTALKVDGKKDLLGILKDKQKEIEQYMKKSKLKASKVEDLKKIVAYYNSL